MTDERDEFRGSILGPTTQKFRTGGKAHSPGEWPDPSPFEDLVIPPGCLDMRSGPINPINPETAPTLGIRTKLEDSWLWAVTLYRFKDGEGPNDKPLIDETQGEHIVSKTFLGATKKAQTIVNGLNASIAGDLQNTLWDIQSVTHSFKVKI